MTAIYIAWPVSTAVLLLVAAELGIAIRHEVLGILIDERGRYSLARLQVVLWTLLTLSLVGGVFFGPVVRWRGAPARVPEPAGAAYSFRG